MENAAEALKIAFAMLVFIIALSVAFAVISQARATADIVFEYQDNTKYLVEGLEDVSYIGANTDQNYRIVSWENVIPTIYRYNQERYGVTIIDNNGNIEARFDLETEAVANSWYDSGNNDNGGKNDQHIEYLNSKVFKGYATIKKSDFEKIYKIESLTNSSHIIGAPWLGSDSDIVKRLNVDLTSSNSLEIYPDNLKGSKVKYSSSTYEGLRLLNKFPNAQIEEHLNVITTTSESGEESKKIEIIYKMI